MFNGDRESTIKIMSSVGPWRSIRQGGVNLFKACSWKMHFELLEGGRPEQDQRERTTKAYKGVQLVVVT